MKRQTQRLTTSVLRKPQVKLFWILVGISLLVLVWYRALFHLPVWFDEIFAKALIFGLPFLIYAMATRQSVTEFGLQPKKFWLGAYLGLALGGAFGFVAMFTNAIKHGGHILIPYLFASPLFWWTFFLAFATAWWESLFFFGFILSVLIKINKGNEWRSTLMATLIFIIFHAPVLLIRGGVVGSILLLCLLAAFAFGQSVVFLRYKSLTAMVVSHAFWGMALLVYTLK